jgi:8-hydroxy-5-deazaflavin:NADPH oxidoreductase
MNIGILGTGMVGQVIATRLTGQGHAVVIGTRNVAETLARTSPDAMGNPPFSAWQNQNPKVKLTTFAEAAAHGEMVFNCTSGGASLEALKMAGEANLNAKVLLDISNPLDFSQGMPPTLFVCNTDSLGEQIQRAFPAVKVVKTLNTVNAHLMVNPGMLAGGAHSIFVSGNDVQAKAKAVELLKSFGWQDIIDLGGITTARGVEMLLPIWLQLFGALQKPFFNLKIVR